MIPLLEGWPTKAKEAGSPHEVRLTPLDTNPAFQCFKDLERLYTHTPLNKMPHDFQAPYLMAPLCHMASQDNTPWLPCTHH